MNVEDVLVQGRSRRADPAPRRQWGCEGTTSPRKRPWRSGWRILVKPPETALRERQPPWATFKQPAGSSDKNGTASSERQSPRLLPASPEFRLVQQDESASSGSATAATRTTRFISPFVTGMSRLVRLLPRWQLTPKRDQGPVHRRGDVANQPDPDPGIVTGAKTSGGRSKPGRPPSVPMKRKREVTRRVRKPLPEPTPATWVMVAPGRYIRGEEPVPKTVVPSLPAEVGEAGDGSPTGSHVLAPEILDSAPSHDRAGHGAPEGEVEKGTPPTPTSPL